MERPTTMPLKEFLIKKLALRTLIQESIIKEVINFQFTEGFKATADKNSIEFSGFGKLIFSQPIAHRRYIRYKKLMATYIQDLDRDKTPAKQKALEKRIVTLQKAIDHLGPKLREK